MILMLSCIVLLSFCNKYNDIFKTAVVGDPRKNPMIIYLHIPPANVTVYSLFFSDAIYDYRHPLHELLLLAITSNIISFNCIIHITSWPDRRCFVAQISLWSVWVRRVSVCSHRCATLDRSACPRESHSYSSQIILSRSKFVDYFPRIRVQGFNFSYDSSEFGFLERE